MSRTREGFSITLPSIQEGLNFELEETAEFRSFSRGKVSMRGVKSGPRHSAPNVLKASHP